MDKYPERRPNCAEIAAMAREEAVRKKQFHQRISTILWGTTVILAAFVLLGLGVMVICLLIVAGIKLSNDSAYSAQPILRLIMNLLYFCILSIGVTIIMFAVASRHSRKYPGVFSEQDFELNLWDRYRPHH